MFKDPFSFDGRIRRSEYGLTIIINVVISWIIMGIIQASDGDAVILAFAYIPMLWFGWAQGAKRCHDLGNSGWWQLIPFYGFWLLFQDGDKGPNQYGEDPKGIQNVTKPSPTSPVQYGGTEGYQGGYSGGHNSPNQTNSFNEAPSKEGEYKSGDLYR